MARKRKNTVPLPKHIQLQVKGSNNYYYFEKNRNTPIAGPRTRIPFEPNTPEFWEMYNRLNKVAAPNPAGTVYDMIAKYEDGAKYKSLKPNSKRDYDFYIGLVGKCFGDIDARLIMPRDIQEAYDIMAYDTPVKAKKFVSICRTLWSFGIPRGIASINPAREIDTVRHVAKGAQPWPEWAFAAVEKCARWEVRTFVALAMYTGQRTSDVVKMSFDDIRGNKIRVVTEKVGLELWIPIHRDLGQVIADCRSRPHETFIHSPNGLPMSPDTFRALYDRERNRFHKHGVNPFQRFNSEKITPHGLRKSAVVKLREAGVSEEDTGLLVGMSRDMVRHYSKGWNQQERADQAMTLWEKNG